jgi:hypothetical protein
MKGSRPSDLRKVQQQLDQYAWLMDNCFRIPGLNWRFGLEALIGLVPGLGDILGGALALVLLVRAVQFRLPVIVIIRMVLNYTLDLLVGMIPVAGDLFDFIFKSSTRNMKLFHQYAEHPETSTLRHWLIIASLIAVFFLTCLLIVAGTVWLLYRLFPEN